MSSSSPLKTASIATTWNEALRRSGQSGMRRVLVDVAFADLDEAAEFRQAGKSHRNRLGGERVQNDVHAAPARQLHDCVGKIRRGASPSTCFTPSVSSKARLVGLPAVAMTSAPR